MTTTETVADVLADMGLIIEQERGSEFGARSLKEHLISFRARIESALASAEPVAWMTPESIAHLERQSGVAKVDAWNCADGVSRVPVYTRPSPVADAEALSCSAGWRSMSQAGIATNPRWLLQCSRPAHRRPTRPAVRRVRTPTNHG